MVEKEKIWKIEKEKLMEAGKTTKKLFYEYPYLKEHKTKVIKIEGNRILLEESIFFPQTSTEPGDLGKINDRKVVGLKKEGEEIWHILDKPAIFKAGDIVNLKIDWDKRFEMMRLHSALHLWAGVFDSQFKERAVAGVVKPNSAYLVFKHELADEIIQKALEKANKDIQEGLEIRTYEEEKRKGFRWSYVGDYPPIPCGGLHVKNAREIGKLILKEKKIEEGKQKLTIEIE